MCARYTIYHSLDQILARFEALQVAAEFHPRYNVAPTNRVPVVIEGQNGERRVEMMRWGLVPFWARDESIGSRLINARAETIAEKPAFRAALKSRRCIVPADGFYEWTGAAKERRPLHIRMQSGEIFGLAGLWEAWNQPGGDDHGPLQTFTIVTVPANELMAALHDRMPAILRAEAEAAWLDPSLKDVHAAESLLRPYPAEEMTAYPVDPMVNRPGVEGPECIAPLTGNLPGLDL